MHSLSSNANAELFFSSAALAKIKAPNTAAVLERKVRLDFGLVVDVVVAVSFLLCPHSSPFSSSLKLLLLKLSSSISVIAFFAEAIVKHCRVVLDKAADDFLGPRLKLQNDEDDDTDDEEDDFFVAIAEVTAAALSKLDAVDGTEETLPVPLQHLHACTCEVLNVLNEDMKIKTKVRKKRFVSVSPLISSFFVSPLSQSRKQTRSLPNKKTNKQKILNCWHLLSCLLLTLQKEQRTRSYFFLNRARNNGESTHNTYTNTTQHKTSALAHAHSRTRIKMAKGKSVADKREIILGILHESKEPFLLKDIEKLAGKKGVVQQTVPEILKTLTDDDLVKLDKIGTTNWYWSFPSEHATKLEQKKIQCDAELKELEKQMKKIDEDIENEKTRNKENDAESSVQDRKNAEMALQAAKDENAKLLKELAKLQESNPELQEQVAKGVDAMRTAADRWTDNLFLVKSWVDKKMGDKEQTKAFFKQQGVDLNTLDYVQ